MTAYATKDDFANFHGYEQYVTEAEKHAYKDDHDYPHSASLDALLLMVQDYLNLVAGTTTDMTSHLVYLKMMMCLTITRILNYVRAHEEIDEAIKEDGFNFTLIPPVEDLLTSQERTDIATCNPA